MAGIIETLRKDGHVIKNAPFSFATVCALAFGLMWGGFHWYYGSKLAESNNRAERWKSDVDYWKDVAARSQQPLIPHTDEAGKTATPSPTVRPRQKAPASPSPSITQSSSGANSPNVIGSGNQISYSSEPFSRILTEEQVRTFRHNLSSAKPARFWLIIETPITKHPNRETDDEQGVFANQLANILVANKWEDKEDECDKSQTPCTWPYVLPKYSDVIHHGVLIESPPELLDSAQKLSAELNRMMFRNLLRVASYYREGKPDKLDLIVISVGTN